MTDETDSSPSPPRVAREEAESAAMPMLRAQVIAIVLIIPILAVSLGTHLYLWGLPEGNPFPVALLLIFIGSIVVHEALHGVGYYWGGAGRDEIEFGFNWSGMAPYAHCSVPLRAAPYRVAVALPGLVLGLPPLLVGLSLGLWEFTMYAFLMLTAASGDALLLWILREVPANSWTQDHPTQMGCLVLGHASSPVPPVLDSTEENGSDSSPETGLSRRTLLVILVGVMLLGLGVGFLAAFFL